MKLTYSSLNKDEDIRSLFDRVLPEGYTEEVDDVHKAFALIYETMSSDRFYNFAGESPIVKTPDGIIMIGDGDMEDFAGCNIPLEFYPMRENSDTNYIEMLIGIHFAQFMRKIGQVVASTIGGN